MDHFGQALQLLASGQLDEARIYLEELLRQDPEASPHSQFLKMQMISHLRPFQTLFLTRVTVTSLVGNKEGYLELAASVKL